MNIETEGLSYEVTAKITCNRSSAVVYIVKCYFALGARGPSHPTDIFKLSTAELHQRNPVNVLYLLGTVVVRTSLTLDTVFWRK